MKKNKLILIFGGLCLIALAVALLQPVFGAMRKKKTAPLAETLRVGVEFSADSAFRYCEEQCAFGPRTMNSAAHDQCAEWIKKKFESFGCEVKTQRADLKGFDGTTLRAQNIIARMNPDASPRIIFCAHWDSRPWADNDPNPDNHKLPVLAANDGASGVAVMLELARTLQTATSDSTAFNTGIDFICFDAEDWGEEGNDDSWALGARHWAESDEVHSAAYAYGILLDMVGGEGARFAQEYFSKHYARHIVDDVWEAARRAGYANYFPTSEGSAITDDHLPVNKAGIPCIDIIPFHPDCELSSFGPTWHTLDDTMDHISPITLKAVGQTLVQLLLQ